VGEVLVISHAGVVDQEVDPPESLDGGLDRRAGGGFLARIADHDDGASAGGFDFLFQLRETFLAAGGEDEVRAFVGQRPGAGASDARAGSSDDGDFAFKFVAHEWNYLLLEANAAVRICQWFLACRRQGCGDSVRPIYKAA